MPSDERRIAPLQDFLEAMLEELRGLISGTVADYIPELQRADPDWFGIALCTMDGHVYQVGDARQPFTVQSISKVIAYGLALEDHGVETVLSRVGVEPSGEAFNSISLEAGTGRPLNPMINAGAIVTTGMIRHEPGLDALARLLGSFERFVGHSVGVDERVYRSESETGHRNRAIAHLLRGYGMLSDDPERALDLYFRQCSVLVNARDLALAAACLANNGVNPVTGVVALPARHVDRVLSVMSTCGMYDYSGGWIYDVGMPAKSGVSGGILAVLPGQFGLGVFSPRLDPKGNSLRGIAACRQISDRLRLHMFKVPPSTSASVLRVRYDGSQVQSQRARTPHDSAVLDAEGHRIQVYEVQGDLMFSGTDSVTRMLQQEPDSQEFVIVDLRRVSAIDWAATEMLAETAARLGRLGRKLFFTEHKDHYAFRSSLARKVAGSQSPGHFYFVDTDRALEWCEEQLLSRFRRQPPAETGCLDLSEQLLCRGMTRRQLEALERSGRLVSIPAGHRIFSTGDPAHSFYLIRRGMVEVSVATDPRRSLRLTTLGPGMSFGELAMLDESARTADVVAKVDTECLEVPFSSLDADMRTVLLANLARQLARRLSRDARMLRARG
jgi:glutaminase